MNFRLAFLFVREQTGLTMKTRPQLLVLAGAAVLALGACATLGLGGGGVNLHATSIQIHPGTNISMEDQKQLDQILRRYKTFLYKIKQTENGKVRTAGRLKDVFIQEKLLDEVKNAGGVSYWALQIGTAAHPDHTTNPDHTHHPEHFSNPDHTFNPDHTHNPDRTSHPDFSAKDCRDMAELVRRVTPILKKYSRD